MSSEVEFGGVKFRGGKLIAILTALSTLGGGIWGGFEVYARWKEMEEQIALYVEPDLSGFNREIGIINETITSLEKQVDVELEAIKE